MCYLYHPHTISKNFGRFSKFRGVLSALSAHHSQEFLAVFLKFHAQFDVLFSISATDLTQNHLFHARFCRPAPDFSGLAQPQVRTRRYPVIFGEGDSPSITADSSPPSARHPMPQTKTAPSLLKETFPDYKKVRGVGPQDAQGIRKQRKMEASSKPGTYHKDYAIDKETGRVRGHENQTHGDNPHINIKRSDGTKVVIDVDGKG